MMNNQIFRQEISSVFAAHGKAAPTGLVLNAVWERVKELPDEFMPWASAELQDVDKLPNNLGFYIAKTLWPQWRAQNRNKTAQEFHTCQDCNGRLDLPGYGFYAFERDSEGALWRCLS